MRLGRRSRRHITAYPIHDFFLRQGVRVVMANPSEIRAITASKSKTDEKDSLILTHLLRLGYIPRSYVPMPEIMRNRELLACIDVGQEICRTKNRIHALVTTADLRRARHAALQVDAQEGAASHKGKRG